MIRLDFVSNSSSSSFCVVGTFLTTDEIYTAAIKCGLINANSEEENFNESISDLLWEKNFLTDYFSCVKCTDEENYVVGLDYENMKDNETLKQFKERIFNELKNRHFDNIKIEHIQGTNNDGEFEQDW